MLYILATRKRTDKLIHSRRGRAGARADFPHLPSLSSPSPLPSRLLSISTPALCSGQRSSPCPRHSTPPPFDSLRQAHLPAGRSFLAARLPPTTSGRSQLPRRTSPLCEHLCQSGLVAPQDPRINLGNTSTLTKVGWTLLA